MWLKTEYYQRFREALKELSPSQLRLYVKKIYQ